jgi:probable rRNA maturation factor
MTRKPRSAGRAPSRRTGNGRQAGAEGGRDGLEISNRQSYVRVGTAYLRKVARTVLAAEQVAAARISIALADNATVRRVNREYLQHDFDTDVLSFLFESTLQKERNTTRSGRDAAPPRGCGRRIDGEVLISAEMAAQTAGRFGWSARDELTLYLIHGLLHLCGYDDLSLPERRTMRVRERSLLAELGISAPEGVRQRRFGRRTTARNGSVS